MAAGAARVLFLDDDADLRATVGEALAALGFATFVAATVDELRTDVARVLGCQLALLDVNLGTAESGIDAYTFLRGAGFSGDIVFLTGHAKDHPMVVAASGAPDVQVFEKPISFETLKRLVMESARVAG